MPVRIDTLGQVLLRKELKEYIKSLGPGDTVKGRVLEKEGGEVTIKATNGQIIKAALATDIPLEEGQFIEMQVDDVLDDKIYASLQAVEKKVEDSDKQLKGLIKSLGLPATDANMAVAKTLIKNNLPVTAENMNNLVNQLKSSNILAQASPQSIIGLMASGNDLRNTSIEVLKKIAVHFEADIKQYMADLSEEDDFDDSDFEIGEGEEGESVDSVDSPSGSVGSGSAKRAAASAEANANAKRTTMTDDQVEFLGEQLLSEEELSGKAAAGKPVEEEGPEDIGQGKGQSQATGSGIKVVTANQEQGILQAAGSKSAQMARTLDIDDLIHYDADRELPGLEEIDGEDGVFAEKMGEKFSVLDRKSVPKPFAEINTAYQNSGAFSRMNDENMDQILLGMERARLDGRNARNMVPANSMEATREAIKTQLEQVGIEPTPEIEAFIEKTAKILSKLENVSLDRLAWLASKGIEATPANLEVLDNHMNNKNKLGSLIDRLDTQLAIHSDPVLKELKEIVSSLSLKPYELLEGDKVRESLRDLVKVSESIDLYLSRSGLNDQDIRNTLSNVKDNIDFMRQVNQYNNFLQIPLQLADKNASADLYVYKDKSRSKLIDPENATILIALDLPKSGRIESMINLNGKTVNATFRLEQNEVGKTIKRSEKLLADRLEAKGYQLMPLKTIQIDEFFNLMKMEEIIGGAKIDKLHIDLRV